MQKFFKVLTSIIEVLDSLIYYISVEIIPKTSKKDRHNALPNKAKMGMTQQ